MTVVSEIISFPISDWQTWKISWESVCLRSVWLEESHFQLSKAYLLNWIHMLWSVRLFLVYLTICLPSFSYSLQAIFLHLLYVVKYLFPWFLFIGTITWLDSITNLPLKVPLLCDIICLLSCVYMHMVKTFYMVLVLNRVFGLLISKLGNGNAMDVDLPVPSFDYY